MPQLVRAGRIELVERIQSNSHWNFDFILLIAAITMALLLAIAPPRYQPPVELIQAVEDVLADNYRLRHIRLHRELGSMNVQMDVGGTSLPDIVLKQQLGELARKYIGEDAGVRLTFRYETLVK